VAASRSDRSIPAVLECANCSPQATAGGALSETVATVSLSTVPTVPAVLSFASGEADTRRRAGSVAHWAELPCIYEIKGRDI